VNALRVAARYECDELLLLEEFCGAVRGTLQHVWMPTAACWMRKKPHRMNRCGSVKPQNNNRTSVASALRSKIEAAVTGCDTVGFCFGKKVNKTRITA
jgi:hypothetical protein